MIGMPSPSSLKTPGVMSTAELAAWAQVGKNTAPQLVGRFSIRELTVNEKKYLESNIYVDYAMIFLGVFTRSHDVLHSTRKGEGTCPQTPQL